MTTRLKKTERYARRDRVRSLLDAVSDWFARVTQAEVELRTPLDLLSLEDRVFFNVAPIGDVFPNAVEIVSEQVDDVINMIDIAVQPQGAEANVLAAIDEAVDLSIDADNESTLDDSPSVASDDISLSQPALESHEIVFVDEGVDDYELLVQDIQQRGDSNTRYEVVVLRESHSGIARIAATLSGRQDIDAVHFVSHGSDTGVRLGSDWLTADTVDGYSWQIEEWKLALGEDADLLIYGCDLASSEAGRELLSSLGTTCDCDVAASVDDTGSNSLGGDWELEYVIGSVDTTVAFSAPLQESWAGVLQVLAVDTTADVLDGDTSSISSLLFNPGGDGAISLREGIIASNNTAGADQIVLAAGTYTLTLVGAGEDDSATGDLDVTDSLTLTGASAATTFIDANGTDRVLHILSGTNSVEQVTLRNGMSGQDGAGIHNDATAVLTDVAITDNSAPGRKGGAIHNDGDLTLNRVTISGNTASKGAGIFTHGGASLSLTNVTVSGNVASDEGGGLHAGHAVSVTNSTIAYNEADSSGAGIFSNGTVSLANTILADNLLSGMVSENVSNPANINSFDFNIDSDGTAMLGGANDQDGVDPLLGVLQNNGGQTQTHRLLSGSTAIDPAGLTGAPAVDQRSIPRDATPDIGAFEFTALVVDTSSDVSDGDTTSIAALRANKGIDGFISLREAIAATNNTTNGLTPDEINFNIAGSGVHAISVSTPLDNVTDAVILDATTQPGYSGTPLIELDGLAAGGDGFSIRPTANGSAIRGFAIGGFSGEGIELLSNNNLIQVNYLGTDATGMSAIGNNRGIEIGGGQNNLILDNLISGNNGHGIWINENTGSANGNIIQGNLIGTTASGTADLGNALDGLRIESGSNTIGGVGVGQGNTISGNDNHGVVLTGGNASGNAILGNKIGVDSLGIIDLGNSLSGVRIGNGAILNVVGDSSDSDGKNIISGNNNFGVSIKDTGTNGNELFGNHIGVDAVGSLGIGNSLGGVKIEAGAANNHVGRASASTSNVISGNDNAGVAIRDNGTNGNTVEGNFIGVNVDGTAQLPNNGNGISIYAGAQGNLVGGTTANARNVISANTQDGIAIRHANTTGNTIQGNYIGLDVTGTADLGNAGNGILIELNTSNNTIGGSAIGAGNIVSGNQNHGVNVIGGSNITIQGNTIGSGVAGTENLKNEGSGIVVSTTDGSNIVVGGEAPGEGNLIVYNDERGIFTSNTGPSDKIVGNTIRFQGLSGILGDRANVTIAKNVIHENSTSANFDELVLSGANQQVYQNTIHGSPGDGISVEGSGQILRNNIVTGNAGFGIRIDGGSIAQENHNLITDATTGIGSGTNNVAGRISSGSLDPTDINADPEFTAAGMGDFTLTEPASPAINAGIDLGVNQPDMNGAAIGLFNGSAPDIGALESTTVDSLAPTDEFLVNVDQTSSGQETSNENRGSNRAIATAPDGSYVVVWTDNNGSDASVHGQRYDRFGEAQGSNFLINQTTSDHQRWISTDSDGTGNFVVTWVGENQDGTPRSVFARRYDADGTPQSGEFRVNTENTGTQDNASVAVDSDGGFVVVWEGDGAGGYDIYGRRYDSSGSPLGGEFQINTLNPGALGEPVVASADNGQFVVVWGDADGVQAQLYDESGVPVGGQFEIDDSNFAGQAGVAMDVDGDFVVVWRDTAGTRIFGRIYDAAGTPLDSRFQINNTNGGTQTNPSVDVDVNGNFVAVWEGNGPGDSSGVFYRRYTATGTALDPAELLVNATTGGTQDQASIAVQNTDNFAVVWSGNGPGDDNGVFVRQFGDANRPPLNGVPTAQNVDEDGDLIFSFAIGNLISISDPDAGLNAVELALMATNGVLTLPITSGLTFSAGDGNADSQQRFQGTITDVNTALDGLQFEPIEDFAGAANLVIASNDLGNTGSGGAQSDVDSVAITVVAVNDPPMNSIPGPQSTAEDTRLTFSSLTANAISISDIDVGGEEIRVTLAVTNGKLSLNGTAGLIFSNGEGIADTSMTFEGTLAAVNAALDGLVYDPNDNYFGNDQIMIVSNDLGNTGSGGPEGDTSSVAITISSINDAPIANNDPGTYAPLLESLNPLSYWRLGEASGSFVKDIVGSNTGTITDAMLGQSGAIVSDANTAISFDGSNEFVEIPHSTDYQVADGTVQFWFKANDITQNADLFSKDHTGFGTGGHLTLSLTNDGHVKVRLQSMTQSKFVESNSTLTNDVWHHVAFSFGSGGMKLYVDGALADTDSFSGGIGGNVEPIALGAGTTSSSQGAVTPINKFFEGELDEVAIFATELSSGDISQLYAARSELYQGTEGLELSILAIDGVLANDFDAENAMLQATLVSDATNGSVSLNLDGSFTYLPDPEFNGIDTFTYKTNDGVFDSNLATATISVNRVNNPPNAVDNDYLVSEDAEQLTGNVVTDDTGSGVDSDADGDAVFVLEVNGDPNLVGVPINLAAGATLLVSQDGAIQYDLNGQFQSLAADQSASDVFTYTIADGWNVRMIRVTGDEISNTTEAEGVLAAATGVGSLVANGESYDVVVFEDHVASLVDYGDGAAADNFNTNNLWPDGTLDGGDHFLVNAVSSWILPAGTYTITFGSDDGGVLRLGNGQVFDTVFASDVPAGSNEIRFESPRSHAVTGGSFTVAAPTLVTLEALAWDQLLDASFEISIASGTHASFDGAVDSGGSFELLKDGTLGWSLTHSHASVDITVQGVNDAPIAHEDQFAANSGDELIVAADGVLANDVDPDSEELTATAVVLPTKGTLTLNSDGSFSFIADSGASGTDEFFYIANDGINDSPLTRVEITIAFGGAPGPGAGEGGESEGPNESESPSESESGEESPGAPESVLPVPEIEEQPPLGPAAGSVQQGRDGQQPPAPQPTDDRETAASKPDAAHAIISLQRAADSSNYGYSEARDRVRVLVQGIVEGNSSSSLLPEGVTQLISNGEFSFVSRTSALWQDLEDLEDRVEQDIRFEAAEVASALGVTTTLSVGYVLWFLRGTYLVSCVLAQMPAWKMVDPLFVFGGSELLGDEDDESLTAMLQRSNDIDHEAAAVEPETDSETMPAVGE